MKECDCGFKTTDENETLDKNHLYCNCGAVVHLNLRYFNRKSGECAKCGRVLVELKTGEILYYKFDRRGNVVEIFKL